ncbi:DUF927 domain-containing protein [Rhodopila sp.]|uniref:DUF927 domain-containing protein n=1 Tax=Rhodopila sp. TaxID=2480087 RepID=UPI003D150CF6
MKNAIKNGQARLLGIGKDARLKDWSRIFDVRDPAGCKAQLIIPMGASEAALITNLQLPLGRTARKQVLDSFMPKDPALFDIVSTPGWLNPGTFVTPCRTYSSNGSKPIIDQSALMLGHRFGRAGKLTDWQNRVAKPSYGNNLAMFALMAAFGGPLMRSAGLDTAGFHLVGPSSIGKTSVLVAAGSIWGGGGTIGFSRTWLATRNAIDQVAASHNETFLLLDEASLAGETPRDAARTILHAGYRLTGGEEKARRTDRHVRFSWRLLYMGSTEHSQDQLATICGHPLAAGQLVRLVDVAADAGCGMGVLEELHDPTTSPSRFSDKLRDAALQCYGTAGHAFLEQLVEWTHADPEAAAVYIERRMNFYLRHVNANAWGGPVARVARLFAFVYASGRLANKFGVLPWPWKDMLGAVSTVHQRILLPANAIALRTPKSSIDAVAGYITTNRDRFVDLTKRTSMTAAELQSAYGILYPTGSGSKEFLFANERFRNAVCAGLPADEVLSHLAAANFLRVQKGGKRTVTRDFPKPLGKARVISIKAAIVNQ